MNAALLAASEIATAWASGESEIPAPAGADRTPPAQLPQAIFATLSTWLGSEVEAQPVAGVPASARALLDLIGRAEAPQGYAQVHSRIPAMLRTSRPITQMTVAEVINWQTSIRPRVVSTAAGRYQIIRNTLREIATSEGLLGALYDAPTQDRLGFALMRRRGWDGYASGATTWQAFGDKLAKEWAGLPVITGANVGRSYYAGDDLNAARVSVDAVAAVLSGSGGVWA
jgi:hypothetical protein